MAIRLRKVDGTLIAVCAAKTKTKKGDIYLDDVAHHALTEKFCADFIKMGFLTNKNLVDMKYVELMKKEENKKKA